MFCSQVSPSTSLGHHPGTTKPFPAEKNPRGNTLCREKRVRVRQNTMGVCDRTGEIERCRKKEIQKKEDRMGKMNSRVRVAEKER